jgi:two-component system, chemotaxis family, protein-glutamate methylesterase/glutaminase
MAAARVLVVDDSATMRGLISAVLNSDPDVNVVGQASDAMEARAAIKQLNPDVVTLDIEMPNMSGLEFLEKIMKLRPMPVIMVSSLTQRGAEATIAALEIGAFDCIGKPAPGDTRPFQELIEKVKAAAKSTYRYEHVATSMCERRRPSRPHPPTSMLQPSTALAERSSRSVPPQVESRH